MSENQSNYDFNIYPTEWGAVARFKPFAEKEGVQMKEDKETKYTGVFNKHHLIGFVGWMQVGNKIRYKADYVFHNWRGKGLYTMLWEARDKQVIEYMKANGLKEITAFCTKKSLPMYKKQGFLVQNVNKNGYAFVKKIIE